MSHGNGHSHGAGPADSAGQPWAGRSFGETPFADDDGSQPERYRAAITAFGTGAASQQHVVDAVRECRLLIPLIASLGEAGENEHGVTVDKSADLAIVTVAGPDGRNVLPVFSSVDAMRQWNPAARPVPADAVRVALAAADEATDLVVVDPTSPSEFVIRRPALWAIAQSAPWIPPVDDEEVARQVEAAVASEPDVSAIALRAGDPFARLRGPEVLVELSLRPGLDEGELNALLGRIQARWTGNETIAARVDSLAVRVVSSAA